jgi:catechol 2,3-dioxygenase-like lactoylglutathione lyase family enzyme
MHYFKKGNTLGCTCKKLRIKPKIFRLLLLICIFLAGPKGVRGQDFPFDHVHFGVPDVEQAMEWYRTVFGGLPIEGEPENRLFFGTVRIAFLKVNAPIDNSVIDHVGFIVNDIVKTVDRVVRAGGKNDGPSNHTTNGIMIRDPWGMKLELRPGESLSVDHVEVRSTDPSSERKWFQQVFGGMSIHLNGLPGLQFDNVGLIYSKGVSVRSEGTRINHIGWRTDDIDQMVLRLRADSVRFLSDIEPRGRVVRIVFVESPSGVKVEILQRQ